MLPEQDKSKTLNIPVPGRSGVLIEAEFPFTEEEWEYVLRVLDVMKPGLVVPKEPPLTD